MSISWGRPRWWCWPARSPKGTPRSEVRAMLTEADRLHAQLEATKEGLASFISRAERVADLLEHDGRAVDEL